MGRDRGRARSLVPEKRIEARLARRLLRTISLRSCNCLIGELLTQHDSRPLQVWVAHGFPCPGGEATPLPRRCWVEVKTLPLEMEATLTDALGKGVPYGSKDPAVQELKKRFNNVSSRVRQAHEQGSPVTDPAMVNLLANLNIIPPSKRLRFGRLWRRRTSSKLCGWFRWTR